MRPGLIVLVPVHQPACGGSRDGIRASWRRAPGMPLPTFPQSPIFLRDACGAGHFVFGRLAQKRGGGGCGAAGAAEGGNVGNAAPHAPQGFSFLSLARRRLARAPRTGSSFK
eukprot:gene25814-biopygen7519